MIICDDVERYIDDVRRGNYPACKHQLALCDFIEQVATNENLFFNKEQFHKYMALQKYFPFKLFEWEVFVFALHNCLYKDTGQLRFPELLCKSGRGTGKNGYISFQSFSLSTPINGVEKYNIDIFANAEDQAKTSPDEIREVLERAKLQRKFYWNKEKIKNLSTGSEISFKTSNAKTKDGGKPGQVIFDEYHQYENYELISVAETGLGKKRYPRKDIFTTDGNVRGGPLDDLTERAEDILFRGADDLGLLPFICKLDSPDEVDNEINWHKANPSLRYFPDLLDEIRREHANYKLNPLAASDFMTKRMNCPPKVTVNDVTAWDNIKAANKEIPDLTGAACVAAFDYAKSSNFISAGLLFLKNETYFWLTHSWVCTRSANLPLIKAPIREWSEMGLLTFVDAAEISPEIPIAWVVEQAQKYRITKIGIDNFRVTLFRKYLIEAGFDVDDKNKTMLVKRVTQMRWAPVIQSLFNNHRIIWGNNPLMNWYTNNTYAKADKDGNITFEKKDPNSRMTDGFMALVAAVCASEDLEDSGKLASYSGIETYTY